MVTTNFVKFYNLTYLNCFLKITFCVFFLSLEKDFFDDVEFIFIHCVLILFILEFHTILKLKNKNKNFSINSRLVSLQMVKKFLFVPLIMFLIPEIHLKNKIFFLTFHLLGIFFFSRASRSLFMLFCMFVCLHKL